MNYYYLLILVVLWLWLLRERRRRKNAAVGHWRRHRNQQKELVEMKELAMQFVGKECLIYTIASTECMFKGTVKEVTDSGVLVEQGGSTLAVNLEYVTCIREWPKNAKGKKKSVVF